ncbi:hypothetical protein ACHHYP_16021 [Achlya hypogyna]|uniref:Uncharacterized protein n=1 Tax=Achlya hypogyna TaxID=1202772 RepID=A0A1V9ZEC5_ACHHY|nr:hypothetical protein ACHHYP_16021 [Achlya hypogyna]
MHASRVRRQRVEATQRQFSDLQWRFLQTRREASAAPPASDVVLQASFLDALQLQHTFDREYVNPNENKILSLLTGETQRDDMLDSLMEELETIRSEHEKAPKTDAHDFSALIAPLPSLPAPNPPPRTRRLSIFRPEDIKMVKDTAHARIRGKLDLLQNEVKGGEKVEAVAQPKPVTSTRPPTPNIIWRTSERVCLAKDIPAELQSADAIVDKHPRTPTPVVPSPPVPTPRRSKKAAYGAWYLPPKDWCKQTADGARCRSGGPQGKSSDTSKALVLREQIPKLFIAREYRNFIVSKNARMPTYLNEPRASTQS